MSWCVFPDGRTGLSSLLDPLLTVFFFTWPSLESSLLYPLLQSSSLSQSELLATDSQSVSRSDRPSWPWAPPSLCVCVCVSCLYVQAVSCMSSVLSVSESSLSCSVFFFLQRLLASQEGLGSMELVILVQCPVKIQQKFSSSVSYYCLQINRVSLPHEALYADTREHKGQTLITHAYTVCLQGFWVLMEARVLLLLLLYIIKFKS